MTKNCTTVLFLFVATLAFAQKPMWVTDNNYYPKTEYLTGFVFNNGLETSEFIQALKASAKSELIESIKVQVSSIKKLHKSEQNGHDSEDYTVTTASFANAEINGLKTEYYYDKAMQIGYALAYANKNEVKNGYRATISIILQKIETAINTAQQFEISGNKGKAKRTFEEIVPLFDELNFSQSLLIAIEGNEFEYAQITKALALKSIVNQSLYRLQTAIIVCVLSKEKNLEKQVHILAPKLKAELSAHGCSFTDDAIQADWLLTISTSTRKGGEVDGIYFAYLEAAVSLVEKRTAKEIYSNNFTGFKGGALDYDQAGQKAYEAGIKHISGEIIKSLEK
jgi:hypothetical protein